MSYFGNLIRAVIRGGSTPKNLECTSEGSLHAISEPYGWAVAEGDISGRTRWRKTGFNASIGTTEGPVWEIGGASINWPASAMQMSISSASVNDDGNPAGTGAQKVKIFYLDSDWAEQSEEVTLDGTNWVDTVATNILRVNLITTSLGTVAAGAITLADKATRAINYARISQGYTQGRAFRYSVPAGKTLFITEFVLSASDLTATKGIRFILRSTYSSDLGNTMPGSDVLMYPYQEVVLSNSTLVRQVTIPFKFPAKSDLAMYGTATSGTGTACAVARGYLEA